MVVDRVPPGAFLFVGIAWLDVGSTSKEFLHLLKDPVEDNNHSGLDIENTPQKLTNL